MTSPQSSEVFTGIIPIRRKRRGTNPKENNDLAAEQRGIHGNYSYSPQAAGN